MRALLIVVALAGCEAAAAAPEPATDKAKPLAPRRVKLKLAWSNIELASPGCFYFSGPEGRDDRLVGTAVVEREGKTITITIDKAVFRGAVHGDEVTVTRQSRHQYGGPWLVNETIRGKLVDGGIAARYHYEECEQAAAECPGACKIDADVAMRP